MSKSDRYVASAVRRLRIGLLAVAVLFVAMALAGIAGFGNISRAHDGLTKRAVPQLTTAQGLSVLLDHVFVDLRLVRAVMTPGELATLRASLSGKLERLGEIGDAAGLAPGDQRELARQVHLVLDQSEARLRVRANHRALLGRFYASEYQLNGQLDLIVERILNTDLSAAVSGAASPPTSIAEHQVFALLEIRLDLERIRHEVDLIGRMTDRGSLSEVEAGLQFNFRNLISHLPAVDNLEDKQILARDIAVMRQLTLGKTGLIALQGRLLQTDRAIADAVGEGATLRASMASGAGANLRQARADIQTTNVQLGWQVRATTVLFTVIVAIAGLGLAAIAYYVVERQINRRLGRLELALATIADGTLDSPIDVHGSDEIGTMARTLENYRNTLIKLRLTNAELERFAYAAAHDLRSPLRAIRDLAQWTIEDGGTRLPMECRDHLTALIVRVGRLSRLLTGLLDYAHIGREKTPVGEVDLRAMVEGIFDLVAENEDHTLTFSGAPTRVRTHDKPLRMVLMHMITNALKHHDLPARKLEIHVCERTERLEFTVIDDGPGIDPRFHDRIFQLFQTLKARDDTEGSGIGLAVVQKLVAQQGGTIQVQSDPMTARGTRFVFDWPMEQDLDNAD